MMLYELKCCYMLSKYYATLSYNKEITHNHANQFIINFQSMGLLILFKRNETLT